MDVTRAINRIHLHATHAEEDRDDLAGRIAGLLHRLRPAERRAVVRHVYWRMPIVPVHALRIAVGGDGHLRAMAGRGPVTGACGACGRSIRIRDRDRADDDTPWLCAGCTSPSPPRPTSRSARVTCAGWVRALPDRPRPPARALATATGG